MTTSDIDVLSEMLFTALDSVESTFDQAHVDLPERRYIAWGGVAVDCEQLTVSLIQAYPGVPGGSPDQPVRCEGPRTAVIAVQLMRCAPQPAGPRATKPAVESENSTTTQLARDAWLLLNAAGVFDVAGSWGSGIIAEVTAAQPQGGFVGSVLTLTAQIP